MDRILIKCLSLGPFEFRKRFSAGSSILKSFASGMELIFLAVSSISLDPDTTSISDVKGRKSHRNGVRVVCQKIGESVLFRTAHRTAYMTVATMSCAKK